MHDFDVIVIGAGVSGCACARELSRYKLNLLVLEKEEDVGCGTTKANSAIVHSGIDATPGSLMARLNLRGNELMEPLSRELDFHFRRNGSLVLCFDKKEYPRLLKLYEQGIINHVKDLRIINKEEALFLEPNLSDHIYAALLAPSGGIVCPFNLTIALAENACQNGTVFQFDTAVHQILKIENGYLLHTSSGDFSARCIINSAGVHADEFHNMVSSKKIHITPRRGEYCLFDKSEGHLVDHTIFQLPGKFGKGVLVTPTIHGNLMIGPNASDHDSKDDVTTTQKGLQEILQKASRSLKSVPTSKIITSFAGNRAHEAGHEFIIGEVADAPFFIDVAGIESPGLTAAPAIGEMVSEIVYSLLKPEVKSDFYSSRKGLLNPFALSEQQYSQLLHEKPEYGAIVCRCEMISEGEIIDAIHRPVPARSFDGIKRRTRAGSGRCQAGFCTPRTLEILAREQSLSPEVITKSGGTSYIIAPDVICIKEDAPDENI